MSKFISAAFFMTCLAAAPIWACDIDSMGVDMDFEVSASTAEDHGYDGGWTEENDDFDNFGGMGSGGPGGTGEPYSSHYTYVGVQTGADLVASLQQQHGTIDITEAYIQFTEQGFVGISFEAFALFVVHFHPGTFRWGAYQNYAVNTMLPSQQWQDALGVLNQLSSYSCCPPVDIIGLARALGYQ